nr:hypothetical protein [Halomicroarcula sp. FL173]
MGAIDTAVSDGPDGAVNGEFDAAISLVRDIDFAAEFVENLARQCVLTRVDGGDGQEVVLVDWCSPLVLRYHRREEGTFYRRLLHTDSS